MESRSALFPLLAVGFALFTDAFLFRDRAVLAAALVAVLIAGGWGLIEPNVPAFLIVEAGASSTVVGLLCLPHRQTQKANRTILR
jgi:hypothetical protein